MSRGLTYRQALAYGLIGGLCLADMRHMLPGLVCDLFVYRRRYDDEQHGVKRHKERCED